MSEVNDLNGLILINKPKGITSYDVIREIKKVVGSVRIGHSGILDKEATGLLIMGLGKATKYLSNIQNFDKSYIFRLVIGIGTDTYDGYGHKWTHKAIPYRSITFSQLEEILASKFSGPIMQTPPIFSSIKYKGERLFRHALKNEEIHLKPRQVYIHKIEIIDFLEKLYYPEAIIYVKCSKGTYIRSLCNDIGKELKSLAHMGDLCRVSIGEFKISQAKSLSELCNIEDIKKNLLNFKYKDANNN